MGDGSSGMGRLPGNETSNQGAAVLIQAADEGGLHQHYSCGRSG